MPELEIERQLEIERLENIANGEKTQKEIEGYFYQEGRVRREISYGRDIAEAASALILTLDGDPDVLGENQDPDQPKFTICSARVIGKRVKFDTRESQYKKGGNIQEVQEVWEFEFIVHPF